MLAAAWLGLGAGLLPRAAGRREILTVAGYGAVGALVYGLLMNLSFWPWATWAATAVSYVPGDTWSQNLGRFVTFHLTTSMGWDLVRAVGTVVLVLALGRPAIAALRRASRRAAFGAPVDFVPRTVATAGLVEPERAS
jgi:energy-coupling factor transport system substrate-specific component